MRESDRYSERLPDLDTMEECKKAKIIHLPISPEARELWEGLLEKKLSSYLKKEAFEASTRREISEAKPAPFPDVESRRNKLEKRPATALTPTA